MTSQARRSKSSRDAVPRTRCEGPEARRRGVGAAWEGAPAAQVAARLKEVRIPPNYPEATLCLHPDSRVQAFGRDAKGRLQILYHARAVTERQAKKVEEVRRLCQAREHVVGRIRQDALRGDPLGMVGWILVETAARPGHERYRASSGTHGASNLQCGHMHVATEVELRFPAKHGKPFVAVIQDPEVARVLRAHHARRCGRRGGALWEEVDAEALNAYLEGILPGLRAKNIRTWRANLHFLAAWERLGSEIDDPETRIVAAVRATAALLQNTPAVARKQYLLDRVLEAVRSQPDRVEAVLGRKAHPSEALEALL